MEALQYQSVTDAVLLPRLLRRNVCLSIGHPFLTIPFIEWR